MELADDNAFGAINDERAVIGHQRDIAEEDFLFLDVPHVFRACVGILVVNGQTNGYFERGGIRHAAFLTFVYVVLELHAYGIAALIAERRRVLVEGAALRTDHVAGLIRIGDHRSAAIAAGGAQMVQSFEVAALAFPISDRVIDEIQLREPTKILDREYGRENRLQARVFALRRQQIHLQEALIREPLDLDQVRDLDRTLDLRKIQPLALANSTDFRCDDFRFPFYYLTISKRVRPGRAAATLPPAVRIGRN